VLLVPGSLAHPSLPLYIVVNIAVLVSWFDNNNNDISGDKQCANNSQQILTLTLIKTSS
jgi:hypothetical protein